MKCGRKFCFHGAFSVKKDAKRREKKVGGFIRPIRVNGRRRFAVLTRR